MPKYGTVSQVLLQLVVALFSLFYYKIPILYIVSIVHGFSATECLALHRVPRHLLFTWIQMPTTETTPSCIQCCL